jgi:hypothetical protein
MCIRDRYVDCLIRLIKSLKTKSNIFFTEVKPDIQGCMLEKLNGLLDKKSQVARPSLSIKARFGLMDLKDLIV